MFADIDALLESNIKKRTVMRIPPAPTIEEDNKLLRETGKMVLAKHIENPPIANGYAK